MGSGSRGWLSHGLALLTAGVLVWSLAGCEDEQDVTTVPPGRGTIDSPYIVQFGQQYADIPVNRGGTLYFVAQNVPAGWSAVQTSSTVDIDLNVFGFDSFFVDNGDSSSTPGSGDEAVKALGDGAATNLYFAVDGTSVGTAGGRFDLSVIPTTPGVTTPGVVSTVPPGQGTLDAPYIIQFAQQYTGIPIQEGGTLFFIAENVPGGWSTVQTASAVDINLGVSGFLSFFGDEGEGVGSFTPGIGNESVTALGDGVYTDLFFQVDGVPVRTAGAQFDVSLMPGTAPASVVIASLAACPSITPVPPAQMCDSMTGSHMMEFDLPFPTAPAAPLSISITAMNPNPVFYRTKECPFCGTPIPFPTNTTTATGGPYGAGYCHANNGGILNLGTCAVNPVTGWREPRTVRVVNNWSTSNTITLSFLSP